MRAAVRVLVYATHVTHERREVLEIGKRLKHPLDWCLDVDGLANVNGATSRRAGQLPDGSVRCTAQEKYSSCGNRRPAEDSVSTRSEKLSGTPCCNGSPGRPH